VEGIAVTHRHRDEAGLHAGRHPKIGAGVEHGVGDQLGDEEEHILDDQDRHVGEVVEQGADRVAGLTNAGRLRGEDDVDPGSTRDLGLTLEMGGFFH